MYTTDYSNYSSSYSYNSSPSNQINTPKYISRTYTSEPIINYSYRSSYTPPTTTSTYIYQPLQTRTINTSTYYKTNYPIYESNCIKYNNNDLIKTDHYVICNDSNCLKNRNLCSDYNYHEKENDKLKVTIPNGFKVDMDGYNVKITGDKTENHNNNLYEDTQIKVDENLLKDGYNIKIHWVDNKCGDEISTD